MAGRLDGGDLAQSQTDIAVLDTCTCLSSALSKQRKPKAACGNQATDAGIQTEKPRTAPPPPPTGTASVPVQESVGSTVG